VKKVLLVLNVFLVLGILPITAIGCHKTEYVSKDYGYAISYPEGWKVNSTSTWDVIIYNPNPSAQVSIVAFDKGMSLSKTVDMFIDTTVEWARNGKVLYSAKPKLKWDWELHYEYSDAGRKFQCQAYFLETPEFSFNIYWDAPADNELYKMCQDIANSFTLR